MFRKVAFNLVLLGSLFLLFPSQPAQAQSVGEAQQAQASTLGPPMTRDEIMSRVREARSKGTDFDDISAEVERRGINFEMDNTFADQIRFLRAVIVTNALWRADDRRKALVTNPKNAETIEELKGQLKGDQKSLPFIEQVRIVTLAYVSSLPNFLVSEQVQRYERVAVSSWRLGDYLELAVSYSAGRGEDIKLKLQNGRAATVTIDQVGGLTSTGQFAGQLAMLFDPVSRTEFVEEGSTDFYGKPCVIYSYRVAARNSRHQLKMEKSQAITGCLGRLYIHRDTKQVLRMEQEAIEIPVGFPITRASSIVDFGWVTIGEKEFLLPVSARVSLTERQNNYTALNCITFHKYSKFETDVKILD